MFHWSVWARIVVIRTVPEATAPRRIDSRVRAPAPVDVVDRPPPTWMGPVTSGALQRSSLGDQNRVGARDGWERQAAGGETFTSRSEVILLLLDPIMNDHRPHVDVVARLPSSGEVSRGTRSPCEVLLRFAEASWMLSSAANGPDQDPDGLLRTQRLPRTSDIR